MCRGEIRLADESLFTGHNQACCIGLNVKCPQKLVGSNSWWLCLGVAVETSGVEASLEEVGHGSLEWTLGSCKQAPLFLFLECGCHVTSQSLGSARVPFFACCFIIPGIKDCISLQLKPK